ncbi:MAG: CPBP family glutamic-type intramembrane protease [Kofleriaceae bacterium]
MPEPRELRSLVPAEVLAIIAIAIIPWPAPMPSALPLVIVASISTYLRRRSWSERVSGGAMHVAIGGGAGLVALVVALVAGAPFVEQISDRAVQWSVFPVVRGNAGQLAIVMVYVTVAAIAAELALRGWIVERILELSPGAAVLPVVCGALAEALVTPGEPVTRLGAACFGFGLGWIYVASGRSVVAPICARAVFQIGAVVLESLRVIG